MYYKNTEGKRKNAFPFSYFLNFQQVVNINVPHTTEVVNGAETKAITVLYGGQNKAFCQPCWKLNRFQFKTALKSLGKNSVKYKTLILK